MSEKKLRAAFNAFDIDKSGKIDVGELKQVLAFDKKVSANALQELIAQVDKDGDGEVSFDEFKDMMQTLLPQVVEKPEETEKQIVPENRFSKKKKQMTGQ